MGSFFPGEQAHGSNGTDMKSTISIINAAISTALVVSAIAGCSAADGSFTEEGANSGLESEDIGEVASELDPDIDCGQAAADKTYTSIISPTFTSPNTYEAGKNGCTRAYFVRVNDYRTDNTTKFNGFAYAGPQPATAEECQNTRLMVYVYERKADGSVVFVGSKNAYGQPFIWCEDDGTCEVTSCILPSINIENRCSNGTNNFNLTTGKNYQFAVSARSNNSGTPVMQKIKMLSSNRTFCSQ